MTFLNTLIAAALALSCGTVGAGDKILAKCAATKVVCAVTGEDESQLYLYREGDRKVRREIGEDEGGGWIYPGNLSAIFSSDGKYLLINNGTGSAGRDFAVYRLRKGLDYEFLKELSIGDEVEKLAFKLKRIGPDNYVLNHRYVDFVAWTARHVVRVELSGKGDRLERNAKGREQRYFIHANGWAALFDLDKQKALLIPEKVNADRLTRVSQEEAFGRETPAK